MTRFILILAVIVVAVLAIWLVREQEPARRRRLLYWVAGIGIAAVLAVVLFRAGLHWVGVAGASAFALLRRLGPVLWRLLPFAGRLWKRRAGAAGASADDSQRGETRGATTREAMSRQEALEVLGLQDSATPEDIQHAYRRLMQKVHPDHPHGSNYLAARINEAKRVLTG